MRTIKIKEYVDPYTFIPTGQVFMDGIDTGIKYGLDTRYHMAMLPKDTQNLIMEAAIKDSIAAISINVPDITEEELAHLQAFLKNVLT